MKRAQKQQWYAASVVMYFDFIGRKPRAVPVWENVLLLKARSFSEARNKAERLGRLEEGPADEAIVLFGKPARRVFGGVRKVVTVAPAIKGTRKISNGIEDGGEATFSRFVINGQRDLKAFIAGKPVKILYEE